MSVFAGSYEHLLDDKYRAVLPLGLRKCIPEEVRKEVLKKGFKLRVRDDKKGLELHPRDEFDQKVRALQARYRLEDKQGTEYVFRYTATAFQIDLDDQFRFVLPQKYAKAAGIAREIYFIGAPEMIQIWSKENWEAYELEGEQMEIPPQTAQA